MSRPVGGTCVDLSVPQAAAIWMVHRYPQNAVGREEDVTLSDLEGWPAPLDLDLISFDGCSYSVAGMCALADDYVRGK